jgi:hypothetical protein
MFVFYCWKCLSRWTVHNWVINFSVMAKRRKRRCGNGRDQSKHLFVCSGFRRTDKALGTSVSVDSKGFWRWWKTHRIIYSKCVGVGGGYVEINVFFFQVRISHVLPIYWLPRTHTTRAPHGRNSGLWVETACRSCWMYMSESFRMLFSLFECEC